YMHANIPVDPLFQPIPIPFNQKSLQLNKRSHFVVVTVRSTSPLESQRIAYVAPCTATVEFACDVAITPSFTYAQSIRSVPLSGTDEILARHSSFCCPNCQFNSR